MKKFFKNLEIDAVTILGGFIILCMTAVVVCGMATIITLL